MADDEKTSETSDTLKELLDLEANETYDAQFAALMEDLFIKCEVYPEVGLALVESHVEAAGEQNLLRLARMLAFKQLAIGAPDVKKTTLRKVLETIDERQKQFAFKGVNEILAIERIDQDYLRGNPRREKLVDEMCLIMESLHPTLVQATLGWTKLYYWRSEPSRIYLSAKLTVDHERIASKIDAIRFCPKKIARSAFGFDSTETAHGKAVFYKMFRQFAKPGDDLSDKEPIGELTLVENGDWEFRPDDDE